MNLPLGTTLLTIIVAALLLASCTVGPDYVRPGAPVATAYKEAEGWKVAEPRDEAIRGAWWEIFDDPVLNRLEEQVSITNQNLALAEAQYRQAQSLVQVARAAYFPMITVGPGYTRSFGTFGARGAAGNQQIASGTPSGLPGSAASSSSSTISVYSLPASLSWEIDLWGRVRRNVEANRASAEASAADLESTRLLVQAELAQSYFQLRALDSQKELLDRTVAAYQDTLRLTQNRYARGVASKGDVLQAETQLRSTEAQRIDVGVQRAQTEHAIALLLGKPPSEFSLPFSPLSITPPAVPLGLPSELLERRPDIAAAERRMASANAQIGVAVAAYYPALSLSGLAGFESTALSDLLNWSSRFWSVGGSLSETVFQGGLRRAQTEQARAAFEATVASYRQSVLTAFQEVEDNLAALRILEQEAAVQEEAVRASGQSVRVTANQYRQGIVTYINVNVAQTAALGNERTALDILNRRMTAVVQLIRALGGGWKERMNAEGGMRSEGSVK